MERHKRIFEMQGDFQKMLGIDIKSDKYQQQMLYGLIEEVVEAGRETKTLTDWKNREVNRSDFILELADIYLFVVNLALSADCDAHKFYQAVEFKQRKNYQKYGNNKKA